MWCHALGLTPMTGKITRRRLLGGTAVAVTGGSLIALGTDNSKASVQVDGFTIPDESTQGQPETVELTTDVTYSYSTDVGLDQYVLKLRAGVNELSQIAFAVNTDPNSSHSDTTALSGNLFETDLTQSDLDPSDGEQQVGMTAEVVFKLDSADGVVAEKAVQEDFTVTATQQSVDANISLGATGEITMG